MWRAFFLAIGIYSMILGLECLAVDRVDMRMHEGGGAARPSPCRRRRRGPAVQVIPAQWWPWSFLSTGAVICLYSFTIPRRVQGK